MKNLLFYTLISLLSMQITFGQTSDPKLHYNEGVIFATRKNFSAAVDAFTKAIAADKNYIEAYYSRGQAYAEMGKYQEAICDFDFLIIELKVPEFKYFYERGQTKYKAGDYAGAIHDFFSTYALMSRHVNALYFWGESAFKIGELESALYAYNTLIELKPNYAIGYLSRGNLFFKQEKWELALADYEMATQFDEQDKDARYNLAKMQYKLKKYRDAFANYDKLVKSEPNNPNYLLNRGYARAAFEDQSGACADWQKAKSYGSGKASQLINEFCK